MPLGPVFYNTQTLGALATVRPLQDNAWIYRVLPFMAIVWFSLESDAVGQVYTFSSGSDIQAGPDAPVQAGATAGIFQKDNNLFDQYLGGPGDELSLTIRETANVATSDINLVIRLEPTQI